MWSCVEKKKQELTKKSGKYPKSADPKFTPKGILTNYVRYITQILPCITTYIASHKNSSAGWKKLHQRWVSCLYGNGLFQICLKVISSCTWLKYCQEIKWDCAEHKRQDLTKYTLIFPKSTLIYPIRCTTLFFQALLLMPLAIKIHQLTKKNLGLTLGQHFVDIGGKLT